MRWGDLANRAATAGVSVPMLLNSIIACTSPYPIRGFPYSPAIRAITLPANISAEATSAAGAAVTYIATATDRLGGSVVVACTPASGSTFALGATTVNCTATDARGITATGSFTVTVRDTTSPGLTLPANIIAEAAGPSGVAVTYTATSTDLVDGGVSVTCAPASGSTFALGTTTVNCTATDAHGNTVSASFTVTVRDTTPPTPNVASLPPASGQCSATVTPPTATDAYDGPIIATTPDPLTYPAQGTYTVHWTYTDSHRNKSTQTQMVTVQDTTPPFIICPADKVVNADPLVCSAVMSGIGPVTASDNCSGYTITYTLTGATLGSGANDASGRTFNLGTTTVTYTITDIAGLTASCSFTVSVVNPDPVVTLTGPISGSLYAMNTSVNFTATFTDAGGGTHTGTWMFDSISQAAAIVEPSGATPGLATATYTFTAAGVYTVKLTVNDSCGGTGTADQIGEMNLLVVVYDPSAGFVTGGGWINSPAGAYVADPTLTGKANFGFVSKYQKGANVPTGNTEFQFQAATFNFHSTVYQWLVVSGAKAQYKGTGTVNGSGNYGFLLTATDGDVSGGGGVDKFRIKLTDANGVVVYDNNRGGSDDIDQANPQAIGGGSIVIHK